jgi:hypothetical protein
LLFGAAGYRQRRYTKQGVEMLFPDIHIFQNRIINFPQRDSEILNELWNLLSQNPINIQLVQEKILRTLRRWQAYRNQQGQKNEHFVQQMFNNPEICNSILSLINTSRNNYSLNHILTNNENDIEKIFNWLVQNLFLDNIPARIVTVSKALLMLCGFSIALDSVVLKLIHRENKFLLTCSGVWPFCLYSNTLKFISQEQINWEAHYNQQMSNLINNTPIGQIMDRGLWEPRQ